MEELSDGNLPSGYGDLEDAIAPGQVKGVPYHAETFDTVAFHSSTYNANSPDYDWEVFCRELQKGRPRALKFFDAYVTQLTLRKLRI